MTTSNGRESQYPIEPIFLDRWSPRAFTAETIEESQLLTFLEAAHWAPSAANHQPWRFVYALRGSAHWEKFVALLNEANQEWAANASALVFVISRSFTGARGSGEEKPSYTHSFDAGAAWGHLALQAHLSGFHAHGMGGIKHEAIKAAFALPEGYRIEAGIAIGRLADKSVLSERNQAREFPSQRKPLSQVAFNGEFVAD